MRYWQQVSHVMAVKAEQIMISALMNDSNIFFDESGQQFL